MMPRNPHNREALVLLALAAVACIWVLAHVINADGREANRVERYNCGIALGLHDDQPGYHIIERAHYVSYEDGSGALYCGQVRMVVVEVPW